MGNPCRRAHRPGRVGVADPPVRGLGCGVRLRRRCCARATGCDAVRHARGGAVPPWRDCTFETILRCHDLTDPVLWRIGQIVHEADVDDERYDAPEAAGLDTVMRGLSLIGSDEGTFAVSGPIFDGLYEFYRRSLLLGREPA